MLTESRPTTSRRSGPHASSSVRAIFGWAHERHGIRRFVASVAPDNLASLRLIGRLGFRRVGRQVDPIDGLEYVFEADWPPARPRAGGSAGRR
ncbi:MAG TPA: GNAT family protein [Candidatus Deferrimicrobiaceae bacterium]|nr:GNAT family protein [Candidatus Deferrimicrobiaceae bacterium]